MEVVVKLLMIEVEAVNEPAKEDDVIPETLFVQVAENDVEAPEINCPLTYPACAGDTDTPANKALTVVLYVVE